jgi:hypothetical protein
VRDWTQDNKDFLFVVQALFRHVSYCFQNMGMLLHIFSFIRHKLPLLKVLLIVNAVISISYLAINLAKVVKEFNYLFYPMQGLIISPLQIFGYYKVYKIVCAYHDRLSARESVRTTDRLMAERAKQETFKFFTLICYISSADHETAAWQYLATRFTKKGADTARLFSQ